MIHTNNLMYINIENRIMYGTEIIYNNLIIVITMNYLFIRNTIFFDKIQINF